MKYLREILFAVTAIRAACYAHFTDTQTVDHLTARPDLFASTARARHPLDFFHSRATMPHGLVSSAPGKRPYASPTRQTVCELVTSSPRNVISYPFSFQPLAHSSAKEHSTTPLQSYSFAPFRKNTGGRYIPQNKSFVLSGLRNLQEIRGSTWPQRVSLCTEHRTRVTEHGPAPVSLWLARCREVTCLGAPARTHWLSCPRNFFASGTSNENYSRV